MQKSSYGGGQNTSRGKVLDFNPTVGLGHISGNWVAEDEFDFAEELAPSALRLRRQAKMKVFFMHDVSVSIVAPREMEVADMTHLVCDKLGLPSAAVELFSLAEVTDDCSQRDVYVDRYLDRTHTVAEERVDNSKLLLLKVKWVKEHVPHIMGEPDHPATVLAEKAWFAQVQRAVLRQDYPVGERVAVVLAGLAMQASLGDFEGAALRRRDVTIATPDALARYLPGTVSCHDATYWQQRLHKAHAMFRGLSSDAAQRAYIAVASTSPHAFLSYCDSVKVSSDPSQSSSCDECPFSAPSGVREGALLGVGDDGLFVFEECEWQPPRIVDALTFPPHISAAVCSTLQVVSYAPDSSCRTASPYCRDDRLVRGVCSSLSPKAVDLPAAVKAGGKANVMYFWSFAQPVLSVYYVTVTPGAAAGAGGKWRLVGDSGRLRRVDLTIPGLHGKEVTDLLDDYFVLLPEPVVEGVMGGWTALPSRHTSITPVDVEARVVAIRTRLALRIPNRANYVQRSVVRQFTGVAGNEDALRDDICSRAEWAQLRYRSVCEAVGAPPLRRFCRALDKAIDSESSLRILDVGGVTRGHAPLRTGGAGVPPFVQRQYELEADDRVDCSAGVAGRASAAAHLIPLLQSLLETLEYRPVGRAPPHSWRNNVALRQIDFGGNAFGAADAPAETTFATMLIEGSLLRHFAPTLTHLNLSDIPLAVLKDTSLTVAFSELSSLEMLSLDRAALSPSSFSAAVKAVSTHQKLHTLSIAGAPLAQADFGSLLLSLPFPALHSLNIGFPTSHLPPRPFAELLSALHQRSKVVPLKAVGLARCAEPTGDNLSALSQFISGSTDLEAIDVARWRLTAGDAVRVAGSVLGHPTVQSLSMEGNRVGSGLDAAAASALCAPFGRQTCIRRLDFVSCQLSPEFMVALTDVLRVNSTLAELVLANNPLAGPDGTLPTSCLDVLRRVKTLRLVDLSKTGLSAAGAACVVAAFSGARCPAAVETLVLDSNDMASLGSAETASPDITVADGRVALRDVDALFRTSIAGLGSVRRLSMCDCHLSAAGLEVIGSGLMLGAAPLGGGASAACGVTELHLRRNALTNSDVVGFAEEIALIEDEGKGTTASDAKGVGGVIALRTLDLRRNEISLVGMRCFDLTPVADILL